MRRGDLSELHYIAPIANVGSIMEHGILCRRRASRLNPASVANVEIVAKRSAKRVPGGGPLDIYVNLYISARNPMLYRLQSQHEELCVLRVSTEVLDFQGAVIADGNAASGYTRFGPSPKGLAMIDYDSAFADSWWDPNDDEVTCWDKKRIRCAEVLVPDQVDPHHIQGAYVSSQRAQKLLMSTGFRLSVIVDSHLFFQRER
ncbi:MAG: DUF4433 domain-containing protein [Thermodesulfobacteriota bacterium]